MLASESTLPCPDPRRRFKNRAHQGAFRSGWQARDAGKDRTPPYGALSQTQLYFRRAWLQGYDCRAAAESTTDLGRMAAQQEVTT